MIILFIFLILSNLSAFAIFFYPAFAKKNDWPTGSWLAKDFSLLQLSAFILIIAAPAYAWYVERMLWAPSAVFISGYIFGYWLASSIGPKAQVVASMGLIVGPIGALAVWFMGNA